jgi:transposase
MATARTRRDFKALEQRRLEGARLLREGLRKAEVARRLGVSRQSVGRWAKTLNKHGRQGLRRAKRAGRPARLGARELRSLERALKAGPEAQGYATGLWTLARVAKLIETRFGVRLSQTRVWQLLRGLRWSCQRPVGRARERDEAGIRRWKRRDWPRIKKKAAAEGRTIVFVDESGLSERPLRTWAPRGQTPVLQMNFNWNLLSLITGITHWTLYFRLYPGTIKSPQVVDFLGHLQRQIPKHLTVLWDGLSAHRSRLVKAYVAHTQGRILIEPLPAYAPELNPAEYVWSSCKQHELPNFCPKNFMQSSTFARKRLRSMQRRPKIIRAGWQQAELPLDLSP